MVQKYQNFILKNIGKILYVECKKFFPGYLSNQGFFVNYSYLGFSQSVSFALPLARSRAPMTQEGKGIKVKFLV